MGRLDKSPTGDPKVGVVMGLVGIGFAALIFWGFLRPPHVRGGHAVNGGSVALVETIIALVAGVWTLTVSVKRVREEKATRLPWRFDELTTTRFPKLGIVLGLAVVGLAGGALWLFLTTGSGFVLVSAIAIFAIGAWSTAISVNTLRRGRTTPPTPQQRPPQ